MNKIKTLSVISLVLLSSSAFSAQDRVIRTVEVRSCEINSYTFDCTPVYNHINDFNTANINANPKQEKIIFGYQEQQNGLKRAVKIEKRMYIEASNEITPDYPETLPDSLQPNKKPDTVYSDPSDSDYDNDSENITSTFNLEEVIKEGVNSRIQNQLQTAQFQFRKQSCENTDQASINKCYTTSPDGAVKKVDTGEE